MTRPTWIKAETLVTGVTVAAAVALAAYLSLSALAQPADLQMRLTAIRSQAEAVERLTSRPTLKWPYPVGAVCQGDPRLISADIQTAVSRAAKASGLSPGEIAAAPGLREEGGRLQVIEVRFVADGPYESATRMIALVGAVRPVIFLDRVDLVSKVSAVRLEVQGRVFCSAIGRS